MKKKIKFLLDYECSPIWVYENEDLIYNGLPAEFVNDDKFRNIVDKIQNVYETLFENTEISFVYKGFSNSKERKEFLIMVEQCITMLNEKAEKNYEVVVDFDASII